MKIIDKNVFTLLIFLFICFNLLIIFDIPLFRQIVGFLFLTIIPGFLILQSLRLNNLNFTERFILTIGLSISFLFMFGLIINNLLLSFSYNTPLAIMPLLISLNAVLIIFILLDFRELKNLSLYIPNTSLTASEKIFLVIPILLPALSVFGVHIMNSVCNNSILLFLLALIVSYTILVCFFNQKFPARLYPVVIFFISLSLLLLLSLRSNHIIGSDTHSEYYYFKNTIDNLHWHIHGNTLFDATLSISLLPSIYQSILNLDPEFLFKILYSLLYSITPLSIYILSRRYIEDSYAFIASIFFMFQYNFLMTAANSRTNIAILFFALSIMILFNDKISLVKKRILFIVFLFSIIVSHYSTAYIFFFIIFCTYIVIGLLPEKYRGNKNISFTIIILFFVSIFFWYSQVIEIAFSSGVTFIINTINNFNNMFLSDSRGGGVPALIGEDISSKGIPHKIQFISTWLTFLLIGVGIFTIVKYIQGMAFLKLSYNKPDFLRKNFDVEYSLISIICIGLLISMIVLPYISIGYGIQRLYGFTMVILSIYFVIGGIAISRKIKISPLIVIFIVLIPYFFSITGITYDIFGSPRSVILNSSGIEFDLMYVHDQENYAAKWLKENFKNEYNIYSDLYGTARLMSQAGLSSLYISFSMNDNTIKDGYIYLRYTAVANSKLLTTENQWLNISECPQLFSGRNKIYGNGGSEVYK